MTFLLTQADGRTLDLDRLLSSVEAGAESSAFRGDGPSTVVGFLLGIRFALDETALARVVAAHFEHEVAQKITLAGRDMVAEELETVFHTLVGVLLEEAEV